MRWHETYLRFPRTFESVPWKLSGALNHLSSLDIALIQDQ